MIVREFSPSTAREEHICSVCSRKIKKGTEYAKYFGREAYYIIHNKCYDKQLKKELKVFLNWKRNYIE